MAEITDFDEAIVKISAELWKEFATPGGLDKLEPADIMVIETMMMRAQERYGKHLVDRWAERRRREAEVRRLADKARAEEARAESSAKSRKGEPKPIPYLPADVAGRLFQAMGQGQDREVVPTSQEARHFAGVLVHDYNVETKASELAREILVQMVPNTIQSKPVEEAVCRACDFAEAFFKEVDNRGWRIKIPSMSSIAEIYAGRFERENAAAKVARAAEEFE